MAWDETALTGLDNPKTNSNPRILWKKTIGRGYSGIAVWEKYLYTLGTKRITTSGSSSALMGNDTIYCLDLDTGNEVWTHSYPAILHEYPGPRAMPILDANRVYTFSHDGQVFCLDAVSGKIIWNINIPKKFNTTVPEFGYAGTPLVEGDLLILQVMESGIALDKNTGKTAWQSPSGKPGYAPPMVFSCSGKKYLAIFGYAKLYILEPATGNKISEYPWKTFSGCNIASPVIQGEKILISSSYDDRPGLDAGAVLLSFDGSSLSPLWQHREMRNHMLAGVLSEGYYYANDGYQDTRGGTKDGEVRCMEYDTGRIVWKTPTGLASVTGVDDKLLILTEDGRLSVAAMTPDGYTEYSACSLGRSQWLTPPTFIRSRIYVRSDRGELYCLDLAK